MRQPCRWVGVIVALWAIGCLGGYSLAWEGAIASPDSTIATKGFRDAVGERGWTAIQSVYLIYCPHTRQKGTGFALRGGPLVTAAHVVHGCPLENLVAISSEGRAVSFTRLVVDARRDLALAFPNHTISGGLPLGGDVTPRIGTVVVAWGYPSPYHGPVPLLTVGHLAGLREDRNAETDMVPTKRLVVNGAFRPGSSGGPLCVGHDNRVIGVVVSQRVPKPRLLRSAREALAKNQARVTFTATNDEGHAKRSVESQSIAAIVPSFLEMTQVVIGEAVAVSELRAFLRETNLPVPE